MLCISEEVQTLSQIMKMGIFLLPSLYFVFLQATFQALIKIKARQHVTESPRKLIKIWSQKYISSNSLTLFSLGSNHNLLIVRKIEKS